MSFQSPGPIEKTAGLSRAAATQRWRALCIAAGLVLAALALGGSRRDLLAQSENGEYQVKAAFLFHFAQLVDWPPDTQTSKGSFFICTFGDDPFHGALEDIVAGKAIGDRLIRIRHLKEPKDFRACHILFLGRTEAVHIPTLVGYLQNAPVLTVGETGDFLSNGGMICFLLKQNKICFAINLAAAQAANLKVGSRLLVLAQNIAEESRGK